MGPAAAQASSGSRTQSPSDPQVGRQRWRPPERVAHVVPSGQGGPVPQTALQTPSAPMSTQAPVAQTPSARAPLASRQEAPTSRAAPTGKQPRVQEGLAAVGPGGNVWQTNPGAHSALVWHAARHRGAGVPVAGGDRRCDGADGSAGAWVGVAGRRTEAAHERRRASASRGAQAGEAGTALAIDLTSGARGEGFDDDAQGVGRDDSANLARAPDQADLVAARMRVGV